MIYFVAFAILLLLTIVVIQIGKLSELSKRIRGEEDSELKENNIQGKALLWFMIIFLILSVWTSYYYRNTQMGFGPMKSASEHGFVVDQITIIALIATSIVFFLTHILLFYFAYKYRKLKGSEKSYFYPDNAKLEMLWTGVPVIILTFMVINGLINWNKIFKPLTDEDQFLEIEATGYQFGWDIRYPGADGKLGNKDFRLIDLATNSLGIDWRDEASVDDIVLGGTDKIVLPKDSLVRVRITAKDVLHSFFLPHFRVKMDAVPGMPTFFAFTPVKTTKEFREELSRYPEWQVPADPDEPDGPKRWETFEFELACAELCGLGHYSMRRVVEVVERDEFDKWLSEQKSFYLSNIRGSDSDPWAGKKLFSIEIEQRAKELKEDLDNAVKATDAADRIVQLKHIFYNSGSSSLNDNLSQYELNNLVKLLDNYPNARVELAGHTDNTGNPDSNLDLSKERAERVMNYLADNGVSPSRMTAKGYGQSQPLESNETAAGRNMNRRTELRVLSN